MNKLKVSLTSHSTLKTRFNSTERKPKLEKPIKYPKTKLLQENPEKLRKHKAKTEKIKLKGKIPIISNSKPNLPRKQPQSTTNPN
jgi:hypothetical protein